MDYVYYYVLLCVIYYSMKDGEREVILRKERGDKEETRVNPRSIGLRTATEEQQSADLWSEAGFIPSSTSWFRIRYGGAKSRLTRARSIKAWNTKQPLT